MQNISIGFFMIILLGLLSGCWLTQQSSPDDKFPPAELLRSSVHGTRVLSDFSATWITKAAVLKQVYATLDKPAAVDTNATFPVVDFDTYGVLFLEMGRRPTGGYAIHFNPELSRFVDNKAIIHIYWNTPEKGSSLPQIVTSPFMLLKIRRTDIVSITVLDQNEQILLEISIP